MPRIDNKTQRHYTKDIAGEEAQLYILITINESIMDVVDKLEEVCCGLIDIEENKERIDTALSLIGDVLNDIREVLQDDYMIDEDE